MAVNKNNIQQEILNTANWKRTSKKKYEVYVCMPKIGTPCTNKFEGSKYVTNENKRFMISGTQGELWVIDIKKLVQTYQFIGGRPITEEALKQRMVNVDGQPIIEWMHLETRAGAVLNWAFHLPTTIKDFPVKTSWGDVLLANRPGVPHGKGDFLVCVDGGGVPNLNDIWVVNGEIFPDTYDMRVFPAIQVAGAGSNHIVPRPRNIGPIPKM